MKAMKSAQCIEEMQAIARMIDEENGAGAANEMFTRIYHFAFRLAQNWWGLLGAERKRKCGVGR